MKNTLLLANLFAIVGANESHIEIKGQKSSITSFYQKTIVASEVAINQKLKTLIYPEMVLKNYLKNPKRNAGERTRNLTSYQKMGQLFK